MTDTYTCASCGETFEKGWSDEEALEESAEQWGDLPHDALAVVCDDCYQKMMGLPPEEETSTRRPSREAAIEAIRKFFAPVDIFEGPGELELAEDGDDSSARNKCGWAFWFDPEDTTSYVHEDLTIEWYGIPPDCRKEDP